MQRRLGAGLGIAALLGAGLARAQDAPLRAACDAEAIATVLVPAPPGAALPRRAVWLDGERLHWPVATSGRFELRHDAAGGVAIDAGGRDGAEGAVALDVVGTELPLELAARFRYLGAGVVLRLPKSDSGVQLDELLRGDVVVTRVDAAGRVLDAARTQVAAALDARYAAAAAAPLGVRTDAQRTTFALWAPTARAVAACVHPDGHAPASDAWPLRRDDATGIWHGQRPGDRRGSYYTYLVDVHVPDVGLVRNRVTDPYAIGLTTDSKRAYVGELSDPALKPAGWDGAARPAPLAAAVDMVIYELHVRDFSIGDATVPLAQRGRFLAFTAADSTGMRHLRALAAAGVSDVHLLPVFDFATVPEDGCVTPAPAGAPDGKSQQAAVDAVRDRDCYNWGYDPWHYTAPEGSYASTAADGAVRVRELRAAVQALHAAGLRVGMDVVYNHTSASGQHARSLLDRIVPGYYHRLDGEGRVATSTCCANTATEHRMMAKLMIDSVVTWAREYAIDSFRFDLMGHQPRAVMEQLQSAVNAAAGRDVQLIGEGWNFGEVADGARFVQASQLSLNGSGIGTFSDRARDAVRGGGPADADARQVRVQGWVNGLHYDRNAEADTALGRDELLRLADLVRVGLAGSLRDYRMVDRRGREAPLAALDYNGQPAGYVTEPGDVVNYVENHDNQTLYDLNAFKLPLGTSSADRARVQVLAAAVVAFSQGIAYYHAGIDVLRSKSMDRNSYDSGDWFNRLDFGYQDNHYGRGLPPRRDNESSWPQMRPRLADPALRPTPADIAWTRDAFRDLLRIRASSTLFRLRRAGDVQARLRLPNTGLHQEPTVLAGHLDGAGHAGAGFAELVYFINADTRAHELTLPEQRGKAYVLHPVQRSFAAADPRPRERAGYAADEGRFTIPARSAVVFVVENPCKEPA